MAHKINKIKGELDDIVADKAKFNLVEQYVPQKGAISSSSRETHSFITDLIGRKEDEEKIKGLMQQTEGENISIIPIVGLGGLGKTAVAKALYNDHDLVKQFELKMWVYVSDDFDMKKLMIKIIKDVTKEDRGHLDVNQLQEELRGILDGKKYLLVLDDVWNENDRKWLELKTLLMGGAVGSKIIVTTRSNDVAKIMGKGTSYTLEGLCECYSWELFVKFAFEEGEERDLRLVEIGKEIVRKCKGVPLAIISLGSQLWSTRDRHDWENVRDNELLKLKQKDILPALRLSYERLPSHLQRCFAYCSAYPKGFVFNNLQLVSFWMAHGLIEHFGEDQELEDVGQCYLKELLSKCFFQDVEEDEVEDWMVFTFKMHDLVHDLALSVMENDCLTINYDNLSISKLESGRHLSVLRCETVCERLSTFPCNLDRVRSFLIFHCELEDKISNLAVCKCLLRLSYLRYLNLAGSQLEALPKEIGRLKHLRFLSLAYNRKIRELPNSICKLQSLETLILGGCEELEELPRDMRYMISLRYLYVTTKQWRLPINGIGRLESLRLLFISKCENLEYLFDDMQDLKCLRTLWIVGCNKLIRLPQSMRCLTALEILYIAECENLTLSMEESIDNEDLSHFCTQRLVIGELPKVVELPEWLFQGFVNTLKFLAIGDCKNLNELPESIRNLKSLQELHIESCGQLSERCKRETGVDWPKIAHIPKIFVNGDDVKARHDDDEDNKNKDD